MVSLLLVTFNSIIQQMFLINLTTQHSITDKNPQVFFVEINEDVWRMDVFDILCRLHYNITGFFHIILMGLMAVGASSKKNNVTFTIDCSIGDS